MQRIEVLIFAVVALGLGQIALAPNHVSAQPDPVALMRAARIQPPVAAPDVTFQTLDGQPVRLDGFRGRPVMLTFFTTW